MTPQEKAKELVDRYINLHSISGGIGINEKQAKVAAIICVDEVIAERGRISGYNLEEENEEGYQVTNRSEYWQSVKQEIEKL